jgi:hypothetical protein
MLGEWSSCSGLPGCLRNSPLAGGSDNQIDGLLCVLSSLNDQPFILLTREIQLLM